MDEDTIETRAALWRIRRSEPDFSTEDGAAFEAWIAEPAHAVAFAKVDRAWDLLGGLSECDVEASPARRHSLSRRAMAAALVAAIGTGAFWLARDERQRVSTALGEHRTLRLSDGSLVSLNTDTAIDIELDDTSRTIDLLRGEAIFQVAKDRKRPWRVNVAGMRVEALGTSFGVRTNGIESRVLMLEGLVKISNPKQRLINGYASTGNIALMSRSSVRVMSPAAGEIDRLLSWRHGMLEFNGQTVQQIAEEFNRYNKTKIIVASPETARLKFGGRFGTVEARKFVDALSSGFPVRAIQGDDGTIYLTDSTDGQSGTHQK
jgi:transmembrane sensor